jgi:hypothetical protein
VAATTIRSGARHLGKIGATGHDPILRVVYITSQVAASWQDGLYSKLEKWAGL